MKRNLANGRPKLVSVLGMPRSGTSAAARMLNLLGASLGNDLAEPNDFNPTGVWEHRGIRAINEELGTTTEPRAPMTVGVGIAAGAYERSLRYARERKAFGVPIGEHQMVGWMLADMATAIEGARLMTLKAASLKDAGRPYTKEASMAKLFAAETAMKVATDAVQVHGGYGFIREAEVERYFRDAKITQIYEGTSQIQKLVIAREVLK